MNRTRKLFLAAALLLTVCTGVDDCYAQATKNTYNSVDYILPSANRTASYVGADTTTPNAVGMMVICNITTAAAIQTLTFIIEGKDPISGAYYPVAANVALGTTGVMVMRLGPNFTSIVATTLGVTVNDYLPYISRFRVVHSGSGTWTYSCDNLMLAV